MTNTNLFYFSMVKIIISLKDENNSINQLLKDTGMMWIQIKKSLELLYLYDFIELNKIKNKYNIELTEDGKKLREYFCNAQALITKHRKNMGIMLYGYKTEKELIEDVKKDIITTQELFPTTTTLT